MVKYPEPKIKQTTNKWALIQCNKSWYNLTYTTIYPLQHSRHEFFYQTNPSKFLVHLMGNSYGLNCALLPGLSSWLAAGSINSRCQDEWGFWEIMDSIGPPPARTFTAVQPYRRRGQGVRAERQASCTACPWHKTLAWWISQEKSSHSLRYGSVQVSKKKIFDFNSEQITIFLLKYVKLKHQMYVWNTLYSSAVGKGSSRLYNITFFIPLSSLMTEIKNSHHTYLWTMIRT